MKFGSYQFSGTAFMISGALHLLAPLFTPFGLGYAVFGLIWILLGYFLMKGKTFLSWPVFLLSAFGVGFAFIGIFSQGAWLMWLIAIANFITAASTFWLIWTRP